MVSLIIAVRFPFLGGLESRPFSFSAEARRPYII